MTTPPAPLSGILPWTRACFVCGEANPHGLHLRSRADNGRVVLEHVTREADLGYRDIVHGGITMTLLDEVMTWAAILRARRMCVAAECTSRLRTPVSVGLALRAEGWVSQPGSRLILTEGRLTDPDGRVLAEASGKYVPMPEAYAASCARDFVASPEAIPLALIFGGGVQ